MMVLRAELLVCSGVFWYQHVGWAGTAWKQHTNTTFPCLLIKLFAHLAHVSMVLDWDLPESGTVSCYHLAMYTMALSPAGSSETQRNREGDERCSCHRWLSFDVSGVCLTVKQQPELRREQLSRRRTKCQWHRARPTDQTTTSPLLGGLSSPMLGEDIQPSSREGRSLGNMETVNAWRRLYVGTQLFFLAFWTQMWPCLMHFISLF